MPNVAERLAALGLVLPAPAKAAANYLPFVRTGDLVFIAGQLAFVDGVLKHPGRVGDTLSLDDGVAAARLCALNVLAQAGAACEGDFSAIARCVRLGVFVASDPGFTDQALVANGASEVIVAALGETGRHVRLAVGVPVLPFGASVEIEAVFALG